MPQNFKDVQFILVVTANCSPLILPCRSYPPIQQELFVTSSFFISSLHFPCRLLFVNYLKLCYVIDAIEKNTNCLIVNISLVSSRAENKPQISVLLKRIGKCLETETEINLKKEWNLFIKQNFGSL